MTTVAVPVAVGSEHFSDRTLARAFIKKNRARNLLSSIRKTRPTSDLTGTMGQENAAADDSSDSSLPLEDLVSAMPLKSRQKNDFEELTCLKNQHKFINNNTSRSHNTNRHHLLRGDGSSRTALMGSSSNSFLPYDDVSSFSVTAKEGSSTSSSVEDDTEDKAKRSILEGEEEEASEPCTADITTTVAAVPRKTTTKKSVSWSDIHFYVHTIMLGDNPSVSSGPPICCGPKLIQQDSIPINDYEAHRPERRVKAQLAVPRMMREEWLRDVGYARTDMREAAERVQKIKRLRQQSAQGNVLERLVRWQQSKLKRSSSSSFRHVDERPAS